MGPFINIKGIIFFQKGGNEEKVKIVQWITYLKLIQELCTGNINIHIRTFKEA